MFLHVTELPTNASYKMQGGDQACRHQDLVTNAMSHTACNLPEDPPAHCTARTDTCDGVPPSEAGLHINDVHEVCSLSNGTQMAVRGEAYRPGRCHARTDHAHRTARPPQVPEPHSGVLHTETEPAWQGQSSPWSPVLEGAQHALLPALQRAASGWLQREGSLDAASSRQQAVAGHSPAQKQPKQWPHTVLQAWGSCLHCHWACATLRCTLSPCSRVCPHTGTGPAA